MAATYDPSANTVSSYDYDFFGAEFDAPLSSSYDLKDNPHRYAGEYRDPLWGGYYLQARWYDPDLGIFLSRDPAAGFHPYSYGDGSPVMNVDPTGMSAQTSGHVAGETSAGSILFNVFVAPLISMFTKEYWSDVIHNEDQAATFLAVGIVAEAAFFGLDTYAISAGWRGLGASSRWFGQTAADIGLSAGQSVASATMLENSTPTHSSRTSRACRQACSMPAASPASDGGPMRCAAWTLRSEPREGVPRAS